MSAFLGKIHFWLYNKIKLHEKLIEEISKLSENKGYNSNTILMESYSRYGSPAAGSLEDIIDHSNIHGWLQQNIKSVESRLAYIVTQLIKNDVVTKEDIAGIFYENAADTMKELGLNGGLPQDYYNLIYDYMLEGMPCDNVNQVIENSEASITWKTTRDLHKAFWDEVGGDVNNFYYFRDSWINGFLSASGDGYTYTRTYDGMNIIGKV